MIVFPQVLVLVHATHLLIVGIVRWASSLWIMHFATGFHWFYTTGAIATFALPLIFGAFLLLAASPPKSATKDIAQ